jgi:SAM-dependent methyltransferase
MQEQEEEELERVRRFYDGEYYARSAGAKSALPWHFRTIAARLALQRGARVLDVACGTGEWLAYLREGGAEVSGIDISEFAIQACRQRFGDAEFHCGPAEELPFADRRFDLVTCMGSLEHFMDKPRALREMTRVAKPDAKFLVLVPNAGFLTRRLGLYGGTRQVKVREDVLTLEQWQSQLTDAGLRVIARWRDLHTLNWDWIGRGSLLAWPLRTAQALALAVCPLPWQYQVYYYCEVQR